MGAMGLTGNVWSWILAIFVSKAADKAFEEIDQVADKADQKNIDKENDAVLQDAIDNRLPESDLIEAEEILLNGRKKTLKD